MTMRILYLSQYFPPEAGATQARALEMARNWVKLGHSVTMLAEVPNHPSGVIPPEYRGKLYERSLLEGIDVIRVWVKASPEKTFRNRMLFYLTFMLNAALAGLILCRGKYDLIYATSPPLFVGGAALFLSWARRTPLIFEVRDLWPESAIELGELTNPRAIAWATRLENACYQRARLIVVVTQGILERLLDRGIHPGKLYLAPNGANVEMFHFDETAHACLRQELGLQDAFIAIYAGIHGIAQGLETVIEAAERLKENPGIHFLLVGDGPKKAELVELAQRYQLPNLTFISEQPRQAMIAYLSAADVALIPLRNLELFKGALPSKIFDAWACELPVLINFEGEAREIVEAAQAGIGIPPEDPQALADALRRLQPAREERREMGERGRQFTIERYSRQTQARRLAEKLEDILHNSFKDGT
jgi:colanic acid biosynthesis glycosyl transferase WcaI